jgi:hypothetical protein
MRWRLNGNGRFDLWSYYEVLRGSSDLLFPRAVYRPPERVVVVVFIYLIFNFFSGKQHGGRY